MIPPNKQPILSLELVPKTCHYSSARTILTKKQWDIVRFMAYEEAGNKCKICKQLGKEQGFRHNLEAHEIWEYDDVNNIQSLIGLIALCPKCHLTKHIGRANAMGKQASIFEHIEKVNKWSHLEVLNHLVESFELYKIRSSHEWKLNITLLTQEPYNLELKTPTKRKFDKKKIYKKRKRRKVRK